MKNEIQIANDILLTMTNTLSKDQLEELSSVLANNLKDCVCINDHKRCDTMELTWDVLDKFIIFKKASRLSEKTLRAYKNYIASFFSYINVPLFNITEDNVRDYLAYKGERINPTSVNNTRRVLSCFFAWAFDFKYILYNPCTPNLVPVVKVPYTVRYDLTTKNMIEIKDVANEIKEPIKRYRAVALIDFIESTGCRVEELSKLQVTDLYLNQGKALIHGKGNKERWVCLNSACVKHLAEYLNYKKNIRKDSLYVFSNIKQSALNKPMNVHLLEDITLDIGKQCGIEKLTIHIFRRYFATSCHRKGVAPDTIRLLMGHSNYQTTLRYISEDVNTAIAEYRKVC